MLSPQKIPSNSNQTTQNNSNYDLKNIQMTAKDPSFAIENFTPITKTVSNNKKIELKG